MIFLGYLFNWLELLGLSVLIGGMVILGALVAPTVFGMLPPMTTGGEVMSTLFIRFNSIVVYICLGLILIGFVGKLALGGWNKKLRSLEGIILFVMLLIGVYAGSILTPRMSELRQMRIQDPSNHQAVEQFASGHRLSQMLFGANLILGLMVLYLHATEMAAGQGVGRQETGHKSLGIGNDHDGEKKGDSGIGRRKGV